MKFEGSYTINAPRQKVWEFLIDPNAIAKCLPDLQRLDIEGPDKFSALVKVGVGFIKGDFKMRLQITEKQPPSHATMTITGSGASSSVDVLTTIDLADKGPATELKWTADVKVGGLMAGLGQRMMGSATEKTVSDMFECVKKQLEA